MSASSQLYAAAQRYLGIAEVDGPASHPLIAQWIAQAATWLDRDDSKTAWCGCFRGALGYQTATGVPKDHYRAAAWLRWGRAIEPSRCEQGDTIILDRKGGHHVALLDRFSPDLRTVWLLGGNQSNKVSIARFDARLIIGLRR